VIARSAARLSLLALLLLGSGCAVLQDASDDDAVSAVPS
jgi:hypothetical protein